MTTSKVVCTYYLTLIIVAECEWVDLVRITVDRYKTATKAVGVEECSGEVARVVYRIWKCVVTSAYGKRRKDIFVFYKAAKRPQNRVIPRDSRYEPQIVYR